MFYHELKIETKSFEEIIDITEEISNIVKLSNIENGIIHIFVPHATAGIIINESADPNIKKDFLNFLNKIVPPNGSYLHNRIDNNGAAHIKSSIVGCGITIPLKDKRVLLGTWQSIMFCEFDGPRKNRRIIVQIL